MSRTRFWTILLGTEPTSFRARDKETLVPTLKQLQRRNPQATIKWFERERLFDSPEEAEEALRKETPEKRPRDWRPGGEHRDPRARYEIPRDEKRRRFKMRQRSDQAPSRTASQRPGSAKHAGSRRRGPKKPGEE